MTSASAIASGHLLADALAHRVVAVGIEAAGVDEHVRPAERPHVGVVPVARDARLVVDDGQRLADEPVEKGALADVRSADDGDDRARVHASRP